jgi:hypothetical protein
MSITTAPFGRAVRWSLTPLVVRDDELRRLRSGYLRASLRRETSVPWMKPWKFDSHYDSPALSVADIMQFELHNGQFLRVITFEDNDSMNYFGLAFELVEADKRTTARELRDNRWQFEYRT